MIQARTKQAKDPVLWGLAIAASVLGLLFIFDAGYPRSLAANRGVIPREFTTQAILFVVSLFAANWVARFGRETWLKGSKIVWITSLVLLILVELPGVGVTMNGAQRWIKLPGIPFSLQPAEFAKLATVIYLAGVLASRKPWPSRIKPRKDFAHWFQTIALPKLDRALPLLWVVVSLALIEMEPDLGTAAVVGATTFAMLAIGGVSRKSIATCVLLGVVGTFVLVAKQPYRMDRFTNHKHRWQIEHMDDIGFQTVQSEAAMADGGLLGVGLGAGRAKHVLPAATTDFVMATVAEETGLVGATLVLAVIGGLVTRLFQLAARAKEAFPRLVLAGVGSWIGIQSCVNVMMANGTLPPIGIPLPFISSGGSSLLALWLAVGVCQSMLIAQPAKEKSNETRRDRRGHRRTHLSGARSRASLR